MTAIPHAQIMHESETQRQHARFPIPSRALMNSKEYEVRDLSSGGIALRQVTGSFVRGKQVAMDLKLLFGTFSLGVHMEAEVQHYDAGTKILGCRFINMNTEQISFLNHIIKSFIAGDIVTSGNVLSIAARNNFTKVRSHANVNAAAPSFRHQLPGLFAVAVIGILLATFIVGNLYNSMFIVRSDNAAVSGPAIAVRGATEGIYRSRLDPGLTLVGQNQPLGTITPAGGAAVTLLSPCHCYIVKTHVSNGELTTQGQEIMSLLPINAKPWIIAEIDPAQGKKINPNSTAVISIFGSPVKYTGRVAAMESTLSDPRNIGSKSVLMKIILDQKVPVDFANRLAAVTFTVF